LNETGAHWSEQHKGIACALIAFITWGFYALFFKLLAHVDPLEIVAHRAFWAVPIAGIILFAMGRTNDIVKAFTTPRLLGMLCITTVLVAIAWGFMVWAVAVDRTLETSLGFYINPLLNVLLGYFFLGERFSRAQLLAICLAACAVIVMTVSVGVFPWLSLLLGGSFATYGFIRKTIDVGPVQGFFVESIILAVFGLGLVVWLSANSGIRFGGATSDTWLLIACGPMTAVPLIFFAAAARRLRYSTVGLLQYIAPTGLFLTGAFVFDEPVGWGRATAFILIWTALAIYSFEAYRVEAKQAS
jgi:chloramphenicol-sensitive protein RarD